MEISQDLALALSGDPERLLADLRAERARRSGSRSFAAFVQQGWSIVDQRPLIWTWYLEALCQHLEEVFWGRILRLCANGPPRNGKSNVFAILWPAWCWVHNPTEKFIFLSYSDDLVVEHSVKCRAVVESVWYQDTYRPTWRLGHPARHLRDGEAWRFAHGNRQDDFVNTAGGRRMSSSIKSGVTGRGATIIAVDDPLSAEEAGSPAARELARRTLVQVTNTRFDDPKTGRAALLMQRVHHEDPSAWAVGAGWEHFCAPMEYDPERACVTYQLVDGVKRELWRDPRRVAGEPLSPERFPPETIRQIKLAFGPIGWAGQFQQAPPRGAGAGMFKRHWFKTIEAPPSRADVVKTVRRWDLAATEGGGDWTVGVKLSLLTDGRLVIEDVRREQLGPHGVRQLVRETAVRDGHDVEVHIPEDPGQAGKAQAAEFASMLLGYIVRTPRETGDKATRAGPASAQAEAGNVSIVRAPWNEPFLQVLEIFPEGDHDDDVDAFAGAVQAVATVRSTAEAWADAEL